MAGHDPKDDLDTWDNIQLELPLENIQEIFKGGDEDTSDVVEDYTYSFLNPGACPACQSGVHSDCYNVTTSPDSEEHESQEVSCCCKVDERVSGTTIEERSSFIDRVKEAGEITDVQSTGRKRAAVAYPITEGMICEWSELANAGGGVETIVGCRGNLATDRHHGPDKNTLNNTEGNVHRICSTCHNRWHTLNDKYYGERPAGTEPFIPLDPHQWKGHDSETKASDEDFLQSELKWVSTKVKKARG